MTDSNLVRAGSRQLGHRPRQARWAAGSVRYTLSLPTIAWDHGPQFGRTWMMLDRRVHRLVAVEDGAHPVGDLSSTDFDARELEG